MLVMVIGEALRFESVEVRVEVVPTRSVPKLSKLGLKEMLVPVPARLTVSGPVGPSSLMVNVPVLAPDASGVKRTLMRQFGGCPRFAPRDGGQLFT